MSARSDAAVAVAAVAPAGGFADYFALTKPRVVPLIVLTTAAGFILGSGPTIALGALALTCLGTALAGAGSLALNQWIERDHDRRMARTRSRPLAEGRLDPSSALLFSAALTVAGLALLTLAVDPVAGLVTALTVVLYLFAYTPLKRTSTLSTLIGAIPGALPPVTGWAAATGALGPGAWALFSILFFWQMPHSLAIARMYREDYEAGGFLLLPVVDRDGPSTGRQVVLNALALVAAGLMPSLIGLAGGTYAVSALALGVAVAGLALRFALAESRNSAKQLFVGSLLYMPALLALLVLDRILL